MLSVDELISHEIQIEGGFVNHPNDKGGATKYGITQATLSRHLGHPASVDDVRNLSKEMAAEIYKADYYFHPRIHTLPELLQPQLLDYAINSGPLASIKALQKVLCMAGYECDQDGIVGQGTRDQSQAAVQQMGAYLVNALAEYRETFYLQIVENNPNQRVFLKGWLSRAKEFRLPVPGEQA